MGFKKTLTTIALSGIMALGLASKTNANLIGSWNFNEGSGNVAYDSSGHGRDGLINGADYIEGKNGTGLDFNGNSYVDILNTDHLNLPPQLSLLAWVKFTENNVDNTIIGKHVSGYWNGFFLGVQNNKFDFFIGEDNPRLTTSQTYNDGLWHNVLGTFDGTKQCLYVDGNLEAQRDIGFSTIPNSANIRIGGVTPGTDNAYFIGTIDEVKMYDNVIPEPATMGLLGLGSLALLKKRKNKK